MNTVLVGIVICTYSFVSPGTPIALIVPLGLAQGLFNSLQFSSINGMAYADIEAYESSMATSIASTMQQLSLSFGLACSSLIAGWYLGDLPQTDQLAVTTALHYTLVTVGILTIVSSLSFWTLRRTDGDNVSRGKLPVEA